jgi:hypothetical protein
MATKKASGGRQTPRHTSTTTTGRKTASAKRSGGTGARAVGSSAQSRTTTDHEEIRRWAEERGAHPACVKGTGDKGDVGMLRLDFPGYSGKQSLQPIGWDEFFEKFDERGLALLFQEKHRAGKRAISTKS